MKPELTLHYENAASKFFEAVPIGNGRLGAMVYGDPMHDKIVLNENSMWSGGPEDSDRKDAHKYLPEIRRLLLEGKNREAEDLFGEHFTCLGKGTCYANSANEPFGCYQILGNMYFDFFQKVSFSNQSCESVKDYTRDLYLDTATAVVDFNVHGQAFTREYISSAPDNAIIAHFTAKKPGSLNFIVSLDREENFETTVLAGNILQMSGQLPNGTDGNGVKYACHVKAVTRGGVIFINSGKLCIKSADEALIFVTAATNMKGFLGRNISDETAYSLAELEAVSAKSWEEIYAAHLADFKKYFDRNILSFEKAKDYSKMDLKKRMIAYTPESDDYGLYELYYNYGRYLLICSSRPDGMPCNLQGIWAEEIQTPWNGDWHLNAQQALYWMAESANLSELHMPFLKLTEQLVQPGEKTAQAYYGAKGWLAHTCTNPWGFTSPCENADWGSTTGSSAWQCHHLWEHFLYTFDQEYLAWAYPIMKGAALFYVDVLVEEPKHGWLVTSPSSSPENVFLDEKGRKTSLCMGPAYDTELVRSLFQYCIQAEEILQNDPDFSALLKEKLARMAPIEIGSDGRIKEWLEEYREAYPHHRHLSHLWGLFPGYLITRERTPELAAASEKSLIQRGQTTAGWACSFRVCNWARLRNAERAFEALTVSFLAATEYNLMNLAFHCDETVDPPEMPDILNNYYPFQMDGNQGNAAGIGLMIMDDCITFRPGSSTLTDIYLLPALPVQFSGGTVSGLRARGGFEVDITWHDGKVVEALVKNPLGKEGVVHFNHQTISINHERGSVTKIHAE